MSTLKSICVVGASNWDMFTYCDTIPVSGETVKGNDFKVSYGGKAANQAVQASLLGSKCSIITKVGDDVFGNNTIENFKEKNVSIQHVGVVKGVPSGCATIIVDKHGNNIIMIVGGSNDHLQPSDIEQAKQTIQSSTYLLCQMEVSLATTLKALQLAKESNCKTILNLSPMSKEPIVHEILSNVDLLIINEIEVEQLVNNILVTSDKEHHVKIDIKSHSSVYGGIVKIMQEFKHLNQVVVTLGGDGSMLVERSSLQEFTHIPVVEKVTPVDTTGAGDSFTGALSHYLTLDHPIKEAIKLASRVASISVTRYGTQSSYPSIKEIQK